MSVTTTVLRLIKSRDKYNKIIGGVNPKSITPEAHTIIQAVRKMYAQSPDLEEIVIPQLKDFLRVLNPDMPPERWIIIDKLLLEMTQPVDAVEEQTIGQRLIDDAFANRTLDLLKKYEEGEEIDIIPAIRDYSDKMYQKASPDTPVSSDIDDILKEDTNNIGFKSCLSLLHKSVRPFRRGDFIVLGARVDSGKTSYLISELTNFAPQIEEVCGERRPIILFNNEGLGSRIIKRAYQSALKCTLDEMLEYHKDGTLRDRYLNAMGGWDSLLVFDMHGKSISQIENVIAQYKPSIVAIDMLDGTYADTGVNNGATRTDQLLEAVYQKARIIAVQHDCLVIGTSQLNAEAEGITYPPMSCLASSRTGKAGATDVLIFLGRSPMPQYENIRFISVPKNKLYTGHGAPYPKFMVHFDMGRCRFSEPEAVTTENNDD